MVGRKDLRKSDRDRLEDAIQRAARAGRGATAPTGVIDLGDLGDLTWPDGAELRSVRDLPASITAVEDALAAGLSTTSKQNTVSTSVPSSTDGYPAGAYWTQVGTKEGKRTVLGTWQLVDQTWLPVGEDASRLVAGQIDVGLLDVAMVWAEMIEAGSASIIGPGWALDRVNLCTNSRLLNSAAGWGGNGQILFYGPGNYAYAYTPVVAGGLWLLLTAPHELRPGGGKITIGAQVGCATRAFAINLVAWNAAGTAVADQWSATQPAGSTARTVAQFDVPSTAVRYEVRFRTTTKAGESQAESINASLVSIEQGAAFTDGSYFYAGQSTTSTYRYRWLGAYNASPSARDRAVTRTRLLLDGGGLHYYDDLGAEVVTLGTVGRNLVSVGQATIDDQGGITGKTGSFERVTVGGADLGAMLARGPRGIVAWGQRTASTNWTTGMIRLLEISVMLEPGRMYRFSTSPLRLEGQSGSPVVWARLELFDYPWTSWAGVARLQEVQGIAGQAAPPGLSVVYSTAGQSGTRKVGLLWRYDSSGNPVRWYNANAAPIFDRIDLIVEDIGPALANTGQSWMDGSGSGGGTGATKTPFELVVQSNGWATYARGGGPISGAEAPYQGSYNGGVDNRETAFYFPSLTAQLAGADISEIILSAYAEHWWYGAGGVGQWHLHGALTPGASAGLSANYLGASGQWPRGAWGSYAVPADKFAGFKSGLYAGFGFSTSSGDPTYYGRFSGGTYPANMIIRGVK